MITEQAILARLRNGEKADDIANEMINVLNKANQTYIDEQEAAANKKDELIDAIAKALNDYVIFTTPGAELGKNYITSDLLKELIEVADTLVPVQKPSADDIIADFLKELQLEQAHTKKRPKF
jgi:enoyl reductase-like protein